MSPVKQRVRFNDAAFAKQWVLGYDGLDMSSVQLSAEMKLLSPKSVFPVAYGNEEETGLMDDISGSMQEPYMLVGDLARYMPQDMMIHEDSDGIIFTDSGYKLYPGGAMSASAPTNLECATPEVTSLEDLVRYIRGSELLRHKVIVSYVEKSSQGLDAPLNVRMQRRNVDSEGSRKACHYNFGLPPGCVVSRGDAIPPELLTSLTVSPLIGGAGYVDEEGTYVSAKVPGLILVDGYGYRGTMYRRTTEECSVRFEVRHGDDNFSPWQIKHNAAFVALSIGIANTPLRSELIATKTEQALKRVKAINRLDLQRDGTIGESSSQRMAIAHIRQVAELAMSQLLLYVEHVPPELEKAANELYEYGDDLTHIMDGDDTISLIADRVDWAAKFEIILRKMAGDERDLGITRTLTDIDSQADDMRYDYKGYVGQKGKVVRISEGYGYKLRERGKFRGKPTAYVDATLRQPPKGTRAAARTELMRNYSVASMDWHAVQIYDRNGVQMFYFPNVLEGITDRDREVLATIQPKSK